MTTNRDFEAELRSMLVAQRPVEGAPALLAARVEQLPARIGPRRPLVDLVRRLAVPLAAAAIATAAALIALFGLGRAPLVGLPSGVGTGQAVAFDPTLEGFGLITSLVPTLQVAQWVLVGAALLLAIPRWVGADRKTMRSKVLGLAWVFLALAVAPTTNFAPLDDVKPGFRPGHITAVLGGYADGPDLPLDAFRRYYEVAEPGGALTTMFSIENAGPVPLRLEGILVQPGNAGLAQAHWTAVWLPAAPAHAAGDLTDLEPFEPRTIGPGEELEVYLIGKAGPCAFGPAFNDQSEVAGYTQLGPTVDVAYSLAGLTGRTTIDMGQAFVEGSRIDCAP